MEFKKSNFRFLQFEIIILKLLPTILAEEEVEQMTRFRGDKNAFGAPGIPPRWTRGNKDGIGTAYSADSKIWYTVWRGTLTEIYYPTVDTPQTRDMEYLISDGQTFFHEEKRQLIQKSNGCNITIWVIA